MKENPNRFARRKLQSSFITTIVSISLVLFMVGLLGLIVLQSRKLSDFVKENLQLSVILRDNARAPEVEQFQKMLDASRFVKSTEYISKEKAARELQEDLGEDFVNFIGYNPLLSSIDVRLKADYANTASLREIERKLLKYKFVKEVFYQKNLVDLVNENLKAIGWGILGVCSVLAFISIVLINNTIRLSLYSKRFLIKTMQLVGATKGFIRRPFLLGGMVNGIYASVIACSLLMGLIYYFRTEFPEVIEVNDLFNFLILFGVVTLAGILISVVSTFFSVKKYLAMKLDELYF